METTTQPAQKTKKTALITGASSGLGLELALLFAADGHDVVLVARRKPELEALAARLVAERGVQAHVVPEDLADAASPERLVAELARRGLEIEFLVNNAGFGARGHFAALDLRRQLDMIQVNVATLVHLTGLLAAGHDRAQERPHLEPRLDGGFPARAGHGHLLRDEGVRELVHRGARLRAARHGRHGDGELPGATATEFGRVADNGRSRLFRHGAMSAPGVAAHAYRAMMAGKVSLVHGARNKLLIQSQRLAPRATVRAVAARLNQIA